MMIETARSDTITAFDLQNVLFSDGGSAAGSVTVDISTGLLVQADIVTFGGAFGNTYTGLPGYAVTLNTPDVGNFVLGGNSGGAPPGLKNLSNAFNYLILYFPSPISLTTGNPLTDLQGTIPGLPGITLSSVETYYGVDGSVSRTMTSGLLVPETSITPLPAALPLFAAGAGVLGLLGWRRNRKAHTNPSRRAQALAGQKAPGLREVLGATAYRSSCNSDLP